MKKNSNETLENLLKYPVGRVRVVIDTDAYNEVDDQFAIAWALRSSERLNVEAVYAAPFCSKVLQKIMPISDEQLKSFVHYADNPAEGMEKSYQEIIHLFDLLELDPQGKVFRGSGSFLDSDLKPVRSEAALDLVERAMSGESPLYVLAIGAITNVVSAILIEPKIIDKIVVVWLGGQPLHFASAAEFNLMGDVAASQFLFDSTVPIVLIPCMSVASRLTLSKEEVDNKLIGKSKIGNYLGEIVLSMFDDSRIAFSDRIMKPLYLRGMDDIPLETADRFLAKHVAWSRIIWDVATVGYVMNPNWLATRYETAPILADDMTWVLEEGRHTMRVCHYISRDHIFGDLFSKLVT